MKFSRKYITIFVIDFVGHDLFHKSKQRHEILKLFRVFPCRQRWFHSFHLLQLVHIAHIQQELRLMLSRSHVHSLSVSIGLSYFLKALQNFVYKYFNRIQIVYLLHRNDN